MKANDFTWNALWPHDGDEERWVGLVKSLDDGGLRLLHRLLVRQRKEAFHTHLLMADAAQVTYAELEERGLRADP